MGEAVTVALIVEITALIAAFTAFIKVVWPKIKSTDKAVNHGRMERLEKTSKQTDERLRSLDARINGVEANVDRNEEENARRHDEIVSRLDGLILAMVNKE